MRTASQYLAVEAVLSAPSTGPPSAMPPRARSDVLRTLAHICLLLR
jgi:hypothetical protein